MQFFINYLPDEINEYIDLLRAAKSIFTSVRVIDKPDRDVDKCAMVFIDTPAWNAKRKAMKIAKAQRGAADGTTGKNK